VSQIASFHIKLVCLNCPASVNPLTPTVAIRLQL